MKIVRILWVALISVVIASCGNQSEEQEGVKITGSVEQMINGAWVRLDQIGEKGPNPLDTVEVDSDGKYKLTVPVDNPAFYRLSFNDRQYVTLILTGDETEVEVNAHGNDPNGFSEVSGSYDTQYLRDMDEMVKAFQAEVNRINQQAIQARANGDVATFQGLTAEYQVLAKNHSDKLKTTIWGSLPSLASFYGIQQLDPDANFLFFDSVATELNREMPNNYIVKNLVSMVDTKRSLTIGSEAPEIALPNPDGQVIRLSSLRGNYVLIDFWAAWCKPCRMENPNVVKVYNQYKDKNFEILGVSLDRTKEAWVKAIEQDGLPWKHISDLKYFRSVAAATYQINAIPATYLIDPDGKIIAKNLRGPSLVAKLKEIFG